MMLMMNLMGEPVARRRLEEGEPAVEVLVVHLDEEVAGAPLARPPLLREGKLAVRVLVHLRGGDRPDG